MSSVAPSPPEQGQLVTVRSRKWIVNDVRPSTLSPPALKPTFSGPQHLLTLASVEDDEFGEELQVVWEIGPGFEGNPQSISDRTILLTAVYLPAPPFVPDEARQQAIGRAEAGEEITTSVAKEILAETRRVRRPKRQKPVPLTRPADMPGLRLVRALKRYRKRWNRKGLADPSPSSFGSWPAPGEAGAEEGEGVRLSCCPRTSG